MCTVCGQWVLCVCVTNLWGNVSPTVFSLGTLTELNHLEKKRSLIKSIKGKCESALFKHTSTPRSVPPKRQSERKRLYFSVAKCKWQNNKSTHHKNNYTQSLKRRYSHFNRNKKKLSLPSHPQRGFVCSTPVCSSPLVCSLFSSSPISLSCSLSSLHYLPVRLGFSLTKATVLQTYKVTGCRGL